MISKKLAKAINDQINAEMWSAYLYLSMSQDIYAKGFHGIAHWYKVQFLEEQAHAAIMINYMHSQDAKVILAPIAKVQTEWKTVLAAFQDTLEHEKKVTKTKTVPPPTSSLGSSTNRWKRKRTPATLSTTAR